MTREVIKRFVGYNLTIEFIYDTILYRIEDNNMKKVICSQCRKTTKASDMATDLECYDCNQKFLDELNADNAVSADSEPMATLQDADPYYTGNESYE